ncbi:MAG: Gfo/Idh/MocA family oxidoreductase [Kiritimatiellae bacterium]|nr:Gfo/Idh/MocA family oxidoreductase [Kiritimatiellia bacterium]
MTTVSRRGFCRALAGAGAVAQMPAAVRGAATAQTVKLGVIGCGWYGMVNVQAAFKAGAVDIVAVCDVDSEHLRIAAEEVAKLQGRSPLTFKHYEELLQVEGLDAVIIATPPQWHALPFIAAVKRNLDVYCEKPLAYDVRECRAMQNAARASGRIVQVGFQRRQSPAFQAVRDYLREGKAGRLICAEAAIHYTAGVKDPSPQTPPASLDWDLWCGPAPLIPYSQQVGHKNWRLEQTTGHGHLVDWGIHLIDAARMILGEAAPRSVSAAGGLYALKGKITTPDVLTAHFDFAACPLTWRHRIWGAAEHAPEVANGLFFYGDQQTVFVTDNRWVVIPKGKNAERQEHTVKADTGVLHMAEFLNAVRTRQAPGCSIEEGANSTVAVKLAMIAYETGRRVDWDAAAESVGANPEAAARLLRVYRTPWKHPFMI